MLDCCGHVKIIDFGLARKIPPNSASFYEIALDSSCGSLIYMSPELLKRRTAGRHTDWWAVGILSYELFTGRSPWSSLSKTNQIRNEIQTLRLTDPVGVSPKAVAFTRGLVCKDFHYRLGSRNDKDVLEADFFEGIDWDAMEKGETAPALELHPSDQVISVEESEHILDSYIELLTPLTSCGAENSVRFGMGLNIASKALLLCDEEGAAEY